ncbi:MAG: AhpC/TSA family protein [Muribaculaceae bacterium]|nr:AhpC/TSA family protein [Muribaculaceae bacterium]
MKKSLFTLALGLLVLASCEKGSHYKVVATVGDNAVDGDTAYLTSYDSGDTLSSAVIANQAAVLEGTLESPLMARLLLGGKRIGFVLEPGEVSVTSDGKASGTPLNEKMTAFEAQLDSVDDADAGPVFLKIYEDNRDNAIGPWAFNNYLMCNSFTVAQVDSLLATSPAGYRDLKRMQKAFNAARQQEATAVGKPFADFTAADGQKLGDYAGQGKYTLVDFWASWCGPCRREIPNIKALYEQYKDKMLFVGVAVWDNPSDTRNAIKNLGIPWPVMESGKNWTDPTDLYGISGIPHIMLIDPQGVIVARGLEGDAMKKAVDEAMRK